LLEVVEVVQELELPVELVEQAVVELVVVVQDLVMVQELLA
tara:strand:+ start:297 stop:419 length:123 start_codon:yes stop_codon:yes gene_type:complete